MTSDQHEYDYDDWSTDAASLFRDARRAHDPTPVERASIDAVLARIQAGNRVPPSAAAARGATSVWFGQVVKGSLAVVLLAAASFGGIRAFRQPSTPTSSVQPAPPPAAAAAADEAGSEATLPLPTARAERSDSQPPTKTSVTRRQDAPRVRSQRHRPPANVASVASAASAANQRTLARDTALETSAVGSGDEPSSVTTSPHATTQPDSADVITAANPPAAIQQAAPREAPPKSEAQATTVQAARQIDPPPPPTNAPSELAFLKQMQAKLRESDYATVLTLCAEHERRWPHGVFALEREGVRAIASCGASSNDAKRLASQFLTTHPRAAVAMRVRAACAAQLPKP